VDEKNLISNASETMNENSTEVKVEPGSTNESWLKRKKFHILLGIIGILAFSLLSTLEAWQKTKQQLDQKTNTLNWLAKEVHKPMRTQLEFANKMLEDYNYYKFLRTVYEAKDRDGLFQTLTIVYEESLRANISPWKTMSIIHQESGFNPYAVSQILKRDEDGNMRQVPCAYGLMQINYNAWKVEKGLTLKNIFDPRLNVRTGLEIYKEYLALANGDEFLALFYYNNGTDPKNPNHSYAPAVMNSKFMKLAVYHEPLEIERGTKGISQ
jgi:hypothetical protein